jgi:hypothetical protein
MDTPTPLVQGTRVRVRSAVLGTFDDEINKPFMKDGKLCYTLRHRRWIYAEEVTENLTNPRPAIGHG